MLEGEGVGLEIWMYKLVVQEVEKFRVMVKLGCDGGEQRRKLLEGMRLGIERQGIGWVICVDSEVIQEDVSRNWGRGYGVQVTELGVEVLSE